jgi:hypothetical protein
MGGRLAVHSAARFDAARFDDVLLAPFDTWSFA